MCGILGQVTFFKKMNFDKEQFFDALQLQEHRGPDDSGINIDEKFIFGHKRLSIIDLDCHAKQPMSAINGNVTLIFNGEIYNYQEIKKDLILKGYLFRTKSDTEVLLYSYCEYGIECIQKFNGMFSFAIHDNRVNKTYIVRDRIGIKPIYYHRNDNVLTFSSEIKSILALNKNKNSLNLDAVSSYLSFRYPILDDTFFNDIYSLAPGHYITVSDREFEITEYWSVIDKFKEQGDDKGEAYYISKLQTLLESSVKYRMISDVPLGAFLSGGVDSSVITALMAKNSEDPIKTFTIGFEEDGFNEFKYANLVANKYKTSHKEIILSSENYLQTMEQLIGFKDAPLSVPNEVPLHLMSRELKKDITVVLSGEGADELFGGYGRIFRSPYDYERIKNIDSLNYSEEEKKELIKNFIKKYLVDDFSNEIDHFINIYSYTPYRDKENTLNEAIDLLSIEQKLTDKIMSYFEQLDSEDYYNKLMYVFEKVHIVGLLQRVDTATMSSSVEARVPFVDHRIVEFACTIPVKYKLKWLGEFSEKQSKILMSDAISEKYDVPKYILKKAYEDMLPREVLYRQKIGFPVPLNNWFCGKFNEYSKKILLSEEARSRGLYNTNNIEKKINNYNISIDNNCAMQLWMLINLELFNRRYFN